MNLKGIMGYRVEKRNTNWRLIHRLDHGKSGMEIRVISKKSPEFESLGLSRYMTFEQAKKFIQSHKATTVHTIQRQMPIEISSDWLPTDIVNEFETFILPQKSLKPLHWHTAKKLISTIKTPPWEWCWLPEVLSNQLVELGYSWDYSQRIWSALNSYGAFYCNRTKHVWSSLPRITTQVKNRIEGAYEDKKGDKHVTYPFSIEMLPKAKESLLEDEYNWLRIALFFGLRVEEMKQLTTSNKNWFISTDKRFKFVLNVYQGKLKSRGIMKRWLWKAIPAIQPEQIELLSVLKSFKFKEPSLKKLKKHIHPKLTRRSCRRGFSPWLTSKGFSKNIISIWLGHIRPETYMQDKHYGDPHYVAYEQPVNL